MRCQKTNLVVAFCLIFAAGASAQFLAGQTVDVDTYNDELYLEGAGSYQRIVYEDAMNSTMVTNMIWSEIYVAPCGTRPESGLEPTSVEPAQPVAIAIWKAPRGA